MPIHSITFSAESVWTIKWWIFYTSIIRCKIRKSTWIKRQTCNTASHLRHYKTKPIWTIHPTESACLPSYILAKVQFNFLLCSTTNSKHYLFKIRILHQIEYFQITVNVVWKSKSPQKFIKQLTPHLILNFHQRDLKRLYVY